MAKALPLITIALVIAGNLSSAADNGPESCCVRLLTDRNRVSSATYCKPSESDRVTYLITAYHSVINSTSFELVFDSAMKVSNPLGEFVDRKFVCVPRADLAIFRCTEAGKAELEKKRGKRAVDLSDEMPHPDRDVTIVGNPKKVLFKGWGSENSFYGLNWVARGGINARGRLIDFLGDRAASPSAYGTQILMLENIQVAPGFSGGPVLRKAENGYELVGIIQGGDPTNPIQCWAIQSTEIKTAIDRFQTDAVEFPPHPHDWLPAAINAEAFKYQAEFIKLEASGIAGEVAGKWDVYLDGKVVRRVEFGATRNNQRGDYNETPAGSAVRADRYMLINNGKTLQFFKTGFPAIIDQGLVWWVDSDRFFYKREANNYLYRRRQN